MFMLVGDKYIKQATLSRMVLKSLNGQGTKCVW